MIINTETLGRTSGNTREGESLGKMHIKEGEKIVLKSGEYVGVNNELQRNGTVQIVEEHGVWFFQNTGLERRRNCPISADFLPFTGSIDIGEFMAQIVQFGPFPIAYDTRKKYHTYSLYLFDKNGLFQNGEVPTTPGMIISHGGIGNFSMVARKTHYSAGKKVEGNKISYRSAEERRVLHQNRIGNEVHISLHGMSLIRDRPEFIQQIQSHFGEKWGALALLPGSYCEKLFDEKPKSIRHRKIVRAGVEKILNDWSDYIEVDTLGKYSLRVHRSEAYTTDDIHQMIGAHRILFDPKTGTPAKLYVNGRHLKGPLKVKWNSDTKMIVQTPEPEWHDYYFDIEGNHITLKDSFGIEIGEYRSLGFTCTGDIPYIVDKQSFGTPYIYSWKNNNGVGNERQNEILANDTIGSEL